MKSSLQLTKLLVLLSFFIIPVTTFAQTKTPLLILSDIDGSLIVDGQEKSNIKKGEPLKLSLDEGEHIIQIKNGNGASTEIVTCSGDKQKVVKFNSNETIVPTAATKETKEQIVTDANVSLPGALSDKPMVVEKYYAFDKGDQVKFSLNLINKKGTINFYLYSYPDLQLVYSRESIQSLPEQAVSISKKGIYKFEFATNFIFGRECQFLVKRLAAANGNPHFKTNVAVKWDTIYQDILDTKVRVYSTTNLDHSNKTVVQVNLPKGATYWAYWIGVGQGSMAQMRDFVTGLSDVASCLIKNPIYAYGLGLVKDLPMLNSTATINYCFADNTNASNFKVQGNQYYYYTFKKGDNITTDYSKISVIPNELNLCMWNNNTLTGHDVQVKVGAFIVTGRYVMEGD